MMRRTCAALLAFACSTLAAAADRCDAAKSLFAGLANRGLLQGAFVVDFGGGPSCEGAHGRKHAARDRPFHLRTLSDGSAQLR